MTNVMQLVRTSFDAARGRAWDPGTAPESGWEQPRAGTAPLYINGRFRVHVTTGVRRYAEELLSRIGGALTDRVEVLEPSWKLTGLAGHAWEQCVLPARARGGLLWSPCNTGPVGVREQVVTIHDLFPLLRPEWFTAGFVQCYRAVMPRLLRHARHLVAVSEYTKECIASAVPEAAEKTTVIHSGIGPQFTPEAIRDAAAAAYELRLPAAPYLLSVSSLEPRKNLRRVLAAWRAILPDLPPDLWLVLAGKKGNKAVFEAENLDDVPERVTFTGYVPDRLLPGLYAGAQGFLFPSLAEGFGFPPLEAMACGTPVLTSNTSSLPEVCGGAACYVHPLDVGEIAQGIRLLALDRYFRAGLRERGLARVKRFLWETAAQKTWDLLEHVARHEDAVPERSTQS